LELGDVQGLLTIRPLLFLLRAVRVVLLLQLPSVIFLCSQPWVLDSVN